MLWRGTSHWRQIVRTLVLTGIKGVLLLAIVATLSTGTSAWAQSRFPFPSEDCEPPFCLASPQEPCYWLIDCFFDGWRGGDCDDNNSCTDDKTCISNCLGHPPCTHPPKDCDDNDPCTIDSCVDGQCINVPMDCDDGDYCTTDSCVNGVCQHQGTSPCVPNECSEQTGACEDDPCLQKCDPCCCTENSWDDGNPCTSDGCVEGAPVHVVTKVCDDGKPSGDD